MSVKKTQTKQIETLYTRAQFQPATVNTEKRTVEVVFATETPVLRYDWDRGYFNEVLKCEKKCIDFSRINSGAPVLNTHSRYELADQIGTVENARVEDGKCIATLRFSKRTNVDDIWNDVQDGIYSNISVGYDVTEYTVRAHKEGETPTWDATRWMPGEISLVPIPADINSGTRSDKTEQKHTVTIIKSTKMDEKLENGEVGTPTPTPDPTTKNPAAPVLPNPATPAAPSPSQAEAEQRSATATAERNRSAEILKAVRIAKLPGTVAEELITGPLSLDQARAAIFQKLEAAQPTIGGQHSGTQTGVGKEDKDKQREGATYGLMLRSAAIPVSKMKPEQVAQGQQHRSHSLLDIAKECLTRAGVDFKNMDKMELAGRAITSHTSDFAVILGGVVHQLLLAAYATVPDTWRQFCKIGSVSDFRDHARLRMGSFGRLDEVIETAEYKYKPITDATAEKIAAKTFGNLVNISRKMIINDDLDAFSTITTDLGRAAARSIELDVYALLALNGGNGPVMGDGVTLFHANHGNIIAGAAQSVDSFDAMRVAMGLQKEPGGNDYIDLRPSILLTSLASGGTARILNNAEYDNTVTGKFMVPNRVRGIFSTIIDTPRVAGTLQYMFADPAIAPVLEVVFLDGNQSPFLDSREGFTQDGIEWKIRHDYGTGAIDWRGAVKNPGA